MKEIRKKHKCPYCKDGEFTELYTSDEGGTIVRYSCRRCGRYVSTKEKE